MTFEKLQNLFDKEKEYMIGYFFENSKKKTKGRKTIISSLSNISVEQRDAVIFEYLDACKYFNLLLH